MKLFQQLLVAPAALGLMAPFAVNAAELNINDVSDYSASSESVQNFSDIYPADWAHKALTSLAERSGCAVSTPSGSITRYEAAALLNKCLGDVAQVSEEEQRLLQEFGPELAVIKGRLDGLEARIGEYEAGAFSSTTKLSGGAHFVLSVADTGSGGTVAANDNKLYSQHGFYLDINTSFTGKDLLYTGIEAGNAQSPVLLDSAIEGGNNLTIASLYYQFPVNDVNVTVGPLIAQDDIVAATSSVYSNSFVLSAFPYSLGGEEAGPGAAFEYSLGDTGFVSSLSWISNTGSGDTPTIGLLSNEGDDVYTGTFGYNADGWGLGLVYAYNDESDSGTDGYSAFGVGLYWTPEDLPSFTLAYDSKVPETGENAKDWFFGIDYEFGPGTLSAAYSTIDDSAGVDDQSEYELYYTYAINDSMTIKPGVFIIGKEGAPDWTGFALETSFEF